MGAVDDQDYAAEPAYRTLFNIAALVITVYAAGAIFTILGGQVGTLTVGVLKALVAAALVYYLLNTSIVATAVGLSTNQPVWRVWQSNFLWTAPSYFVGAGAQRTQRRAWTAGYGWLIPLAAAPVYLTFRSYRIYLERISAEQRHLEGGIGSTPRRWRRSMPLATRNSATRSQPRGPRMGSGTGI